MFKLPSPRLLNFLTANIREFPVERAKHLQQLGQFSEACDAYVDLARSKSDKLSLQDRMIFLDYANVCVGQARGHVQPSYDKTKIKELVDVVMLQNRIVKEIELRIAVAQSNNDTDYIRDLQEAQIMVSMSILTPSMLYNDICVKLRLYESCIAIRFHCGFQGDAAGLVVLYENLLDSKARHALKTRQPDILKMQVFNLVELCKNSARDGTNMELGALPVRLLAQNLVNFAVQLLSPAHSDLSPRRAGAQTNRLGLLGSAGQTPAAWGYFVLREAGVPWAQIHEVYRLSSTQRLVIEEREAAEALELIIADRISEVFYNFFEFDVNFFQNRAKHFSQNFVKNVSQNRAKIL